MLGIAQLVERQTVVSELSVGRWFESGSRDFFLFFQMPNHFIVHASFEHFFSQCLAKHNILITQDGIFDIIFPKRSLALKFLHFPPNFSLYKQVQSYKHIELIIINCPQDSRENVKLQALPLSVTFIQNPQQICSLLAKNHLPSNDFHHEIDREIMAKFFRQANSCSETDALLLAYQYDSLSHYFDK